MSVNDIRYKRLGYVALNVTNVERSARFYREIVGLTAGPVRGAGWASFRCSDRLHDLILFRGAQPGLKRLGWEMEDHEALVAVAKSLGEAGIAVSTVPEAELALLGVGHAIRAIDPVTGATYEFYVGMAAADEPFVKSHTAIARLGHVVVGSPDREASERFMIDRLNFRVSDRIQDTVTFMRCFPNPYHHSFGIGRASASTFHHINFMVSSMDDIGIALNRLKRNDVPIVFGPGKHPPSESVFLYYLDPDGLTVEYSFGMEEFPEVAPREPRAMPLGIESVDYWGGTPQPGMGWKGVIEKEVASDE
ncbi:bleomycin resistance protein [Pandoraea fibrosis]|uniref:Bleomycin resistance protein n=1 Tax=Pandoraea fibrosis TaxID=1891094 RepID=A0ABX6HXA3_9BURK|nr:VOC family protein [Pandoraea fibrosis]QHE91517.1 bleomycin resistance protein [Pandoraea fibrosis]QHF14925.1 bleomycin resistance protein [Pandoraea fibrosis]